MKKTFFIIAVLSVILIAVIPLFKPYATGTADGLAHKFRLVSFHRSINEGNIRPRWLEDQALSYGSPLFLFNYLVPYYLIDGFFRLGFSINRSVQIFAAFTLTCSFLSMYLLAKKLWNKKAALTAASVYMLAPYHLLSIYLYDSWGEMMAFVFPPLILYLMLMFYDWHENCLNKIKGAWGGVLIYLGGVFCWILFILSHNVSALLFSPIILILGLLMSDNKSQKPILTINAFVMTSLLASFFVFPAILLNKYTAYPGLILKEMGMRGAYFKSLKSLIIFSFEVLKKGSSWYYDFALGMPLIIVFIAGLAVLLLFAKKVLDRKDFNKRTQCVLKVLKKNKLVVVLFMLFYLGLYLANNASNWVWEVFPLQFIVYPYRFLFISVFTGSLLSGWIIKNKRFVYFVLVVLAVINALPFINPKIEVFPFQDAYFEQPQTVFNAPGTLKNMATQEFLPSTASLDFLRQEEEKFIQTKKLPDKFIFEEAEVDVLDTNINIEEMELRYSSKNPATLTVSTFAFPNWQGFIDDQELYLRKDLAGRIQAELPEGQHVFRLVFAKSKIEKVSELVSLLAVIFLLTQIYLYIKVTKQKK